MGYDENQFVGLVDSVYKCSACAGVLKNPVSTPCGHVFCSDCVLAMVIEERKCPVVGCGRSLDDVFVGLHPTDLPEAQRLRETISDMRVRCRFRSRGCDAIIRVAELAGHVIDCPRRIVTRRRHSCDNIQPVRDNSMPHSDVAGVDTHGCLVDMRRRVARYQARIVYLEAVLRWLTAEYGRRCSALLARIATLTSHSPTGPPPCDKGDGQQHVGATMIVLSFFLSLFHIVSFLFFFIFIDH